MRIPQPLLPTADKLEPYLKRIDENRYYTNVGPLVLEYEKRLGELFGPCISVSSCTSGLTACLMALNLPKGSYVACPSWTFVATASTIVSAGYVPYFMDVDEKLWEMKYDRSSGVKAIIIVAPFGAPVSTMQAMEIFAEETGIPVIFDAAASFDSFSSLGESGDCPVVISTHATKSFGTGEGGIVVCKDDKYLGKVRSISNFGLGVGQGTGQSAELIGINAKMSEYQAAVGLAELDGWEEKRLRLLGVKHAYMEEFRNITIDTPIMDVRWVANTFPVRLDCPAAPVILGMRKHGVSCRAWTPVHRYQAYRDYPRTEMPVTDALAESVLLLPFGIDVTTEEIEFMGKALKESL